MALPRPEDLFKGPPRSPKEAIGRLTNIFAGGEQVDLVDAILADVSDAIPFVGDLFSGVREAQIISKPGVQNREAKAIIQGIDALVGIVPIVGDVLDLFMPSQTINFLIDRGALPTPPDLPPLPELPRPEEFVPGMRKALPAGRQGTW
jgi:hypothetical protein